MSWKRSKPESPLSACRDKCSMHRFSTCTKVSNCRSSPNEATTWPGAPIPAYRSFARLTTCSQRISNWSWSIPPDRLMPIIAGRPLEAGKHVVVEKPFVPTSAEAQALIRLAEEKGLLLTVFQNRRFDGDFLTVKQILQSGELGRIVEFQSAFQRYRPDMAAARAPWREEPLPGNGITYDLCSHLSDQALARSSAGLTVFGLHWLHNGTAAESTTTA